MQHYPVIDMRPNSSHNLVYSERYTAIIDKHKNVRAILAGHYHSSQETEINGVHHIISGAASGDNPSYRLVLVHNNGSGIDLFSQTIPIK